jgi:hypothetical protein
LSDIKNIGGQALVTHACNPSYSGGGDQVDHGLKPAWENSSQDRISKTPITKKKAGGMAQDVGSEFKPQCHKKKKERKKEIQEEEQVWREHSLQDRTLL